MNKYLLCIGSNTDRIVNMENCRRLLSRQYCDIEFSEIIETDPFGDGYSGTFLNQLIIVSTDQSIDTVNNYLDRVEKELGRLVDDKAKGIIKIDVDLLAQNSKIIKHDDFNRPYLPLLLKEIDYPID